MWFGAIIRHNTPLEFIIGERRLPTKSLDIPNTIFSICIIHGDTIILLTAKTVVFALIFRKPRNWTGFCTLTVPCRCWKSYLPYSKRSENIINRKIRQFYIEAIPQFFSQLRKKFFFSEFKKKSKFFRPKKFENCRQKSDKKSQISNLKRQIFADNFSNFFFGRLFFEFFSSSSK